MEKLISAVKNIASEDKTVIVGLDGLGGAGKSTVSLELEASLKNCGYNVTVLPIDDFIHSKAVRYNDKFEEWECYYNLQWRYDYLIENVVIPIKSGSYSGSIEFYDKDHDTYFLQSLNVPKGSIVIIEGVFLQRPELNGVFDFMIYMNVSEEIRLQRVLKRDGYIGNEQQIRDKYDNRYFPAEHKYVELCSPCKNADIVI